MMDWFNTNFYRDFGYGLAYPQLFPHHKRPDEAVQQATIAWGKERAAGLAQGPERLLAGAEQAVPCGDQMTIADYFGVCLLTLGEVSAATSPPTQRRALGDRMKPAAELAQVNEAHYGYAEAVKGQPFVIV